MGLNRRNTSSSPCERLDSRGALGTTFKRACKCMQGFYGVYEKVFNDIWEAEVRAYDESERTAPDRPPSFGETFRWSAGYC